MPLRTETKAACLQVYVPTAKFKAGQLQALCDLAGGYTVVPTLGCWKDKGVMTSEKTAVVTLWFDPTAVGHVRAALNAYIALLHKGGEKAVMYVLCDVAYVVHAE